MLGTCSDLTSELQDKLGITLPDDLDSLLGQGIALSLSGTSLDDLSTVQGPEDMPAGLTIKGDPDRITSVISKMEAKQGKTLADSGVAVEGGNGKVTVSFKARYAKALQGKGNLGDNAALKRVVPEADKASAVVYVDLNSRWRQAIAKALDSDSSSSRQQFLVNTEPLGALGLSSWSEDDTSHLLVELTTD